MRSPSTPKPPDPVAVASAQTGQNQSTALYETMLNMQNQTTPYGSVNWNQTGNWTYTDPATGKTASVPRFTATTTLSPEQQVLLNQEHQFDARWNQMALDQTARVRDTLSKPFDYNPGVHEAWAGGLYDKLNSGAIARGKDDLEQSLANRGLNYGTAAYDQAMKDFYEGNQRSRDAFMLDSYGTGMNTALTMRNQPLKEGTALMGAGQITEPTWLQGPQSGVANTDVAGITQNAYNQQLARAGQQQQASAGMWGALGQLGGAALGGWMASDERIKTNIETLGVDPDNGLPVKAWQYAAGGGRQVTPTAQDVEQLYPDAVAEIDGIKHVNWSRVPGGQKYQQAPTIDPRMYGTPDWPMRMLPDGEMLRGQDMINPKGDPAWDIEQTLPPIKQQEARKGGLQTLGARRLG